MLAVLTVTLDCSGSPSMMYLAIDSTFWTHNIKDSRSGAWQTSSCMPTTVLRALVRSVFAVWDGVVTTHDVLRRVSIVQTSYSSL